MPELDDLYQQIIIEHNRSPRNYRTIPRPTHQAEGDNPLCGDHITLQVELDGDVIRDVGFQGSGCAISQASASVMTTVVMGKPRQEAEALFHAFHEMVTAPLSGATHPKAPGKLAAFAGVRQFPARVKCASLAWHTLQAALKSSAKSVSTE